MQFCCTTRWKRKPLERLQRQPELLPAHLLAVDDDVVRVAAVGVAVIGPDEFAGDLVAGQHQRGVGAGPVEVNGADCLAGLDNQVLHLRVDGLVVAADGGDRGEREALHADLAQVHHHTVVAAPHPKRQLTCRAVRAGDRDRWRRARWRRQTTRAARPLACTRGAEASESREHRGDLQAETVVALLHPATVSAAVVTDAVHAT